MIHVKWIVLAKIRIMDAKQDLKATTIAVNTLGQGGDNAAVEAALHDAIRAVERLEYLMDNTFGN